MTDLKLVVFHSQTDSAYNVLKSMVYNIGEDSVIEALVDILNPREDSIIAALRYDYIRALLEINGLDHDAGYCEMIQFLKDHIKA